MEFERSPRKPMSDLCLVPLVDIVFFLIFYFLVAGNVEPPPIIPIDLPVAKSGKMLEQGETVLMLGPYDEVLLDDEPIAAADIPKLLRAKRNFYSNLVVSVKADAKMEAVKLIAIMDFIKEAGVTNISIITQSPAGGK